MSDTTWGADVPVSMPEPLDANVPSLVPMSGFTMTEWGLQHDLNEATHEAIRTPTFAPPEPITEYDDGRS